MVDSAIYEAVLNMMESLITEYDKSGYIRERTGAILPNIAPSNVYPTRDGLVLIAANQDTVFKRLCDAMGQPQLADHADYCHHQARGRHQRGTRRVDRALERRFTDPRGARSHGHDTACRRG